MSNETKTAEKANRRKRLVRKWTLRTVAVAVGIAIGEICPLLPVEKQAFCHLAAKLLALLGG